MRLLPLTAQQVSSSQQFTTAAALGELTQLKLGQAAYQNASNPQVKSFAKQMVDVHSEAVDRLMGVSFHGKSDGPHRSR